METTITKLEELEATKRELDARITRAVALASSGESNGTELPQLTQRLATVNEQIEQAKAEQDRVEREQAANLQAKAREDFPLALAECEKQRTAFLEHRRAACIALGKYFPALNRAFDLCGKLSHPDLGPFPADLNACRALELGDAPERSLADLRCDMAEHWQTTFAVTPRYETQNSKRGD